MLRKVNLLTMYLPLEASILTVGYVKLPDTCPVCDYHPLNPNDCTENVPLRKTIQVFLRHAEEKSAQRPRGVNSMEKDQVARVWIVLICSHQEGKSRVE